MSNYNFKGDTSDDSENDKNGDSKHDEDEVEKSAKEKK